MGWLSLDAASRADVEEWVVQAHVVRNGFEVAGRKASGMSEVWVEGLGSDEVMDDVARSRGQHADGSVDVDFPEQQRQDCRPIFMDGVTLAQKPYRSLRQGESIRATRYLTVSVSYTHLRAHETRH